MASLQLFIRFFPITTIFSCFKYFIDFLVILCSTRTAYEKLHTIITLKLLLSRSSICSLAISQVEMLVSFIALLWTHVFCLFISEVLLLTEVGFFVVVVLFLKHIFSMLC